MDSYQLLEKTSVVTDSIFLGKPGSLALINDWLAVYDFHDGNMVTWITPDRKDSKRNVAVGVGPGEFFPPLTLYADSEKNHIRMMFRSMQKCYTFRWKDVLEGRFTDPISIDSLAKIPGKIIPCDSLFVANDMQEDGNLFSLLSAKRGLLCRFGVYPGDIDSKFKSPQSRNMITQSTLSYNKRNKTLVAAGCMSDMLSFYKVGNDTAKLFKEYFTIDADMDVKEKNNGISLVPNSSTISTYLNLYSTDSFFYALYWGSPYGKLPEKNYIQVFDWSGNFIKGYVISDILTSIAVDEKKGILYGISRVDEPTINIYQLN